jgi:hypothetical protein
VTTQTDERRNQQEHGSRGEGDSAARVVVAISRRISIDRHDIIWCRGGAIYDIDYE